MKCKVLKGTELFDQLEAVLNRAKSAEKTTNAFTDEFGVAKYRPWYQSIGGGITSMIFENEPDLKVWKSSGFGKNEYMPRCNNKAGKEIQKRIDAFQKVTWDDLNEVISKKSSPFWCPGIINTKECMLLNISDKNVNELIKSKDLIEILDSEYFTLKEAFEAKKITQPIA